MSQCLKCSKELSKRQKYYCSNDCKLTHKDGIIKRTQPKQEQNKSKKIVCKLDNSEFKDISNYSGVLTKHLKSLGITDSDVFKYYTIVDKEEDTRDKWSCKYCTWSTVDITNKSGCITTHIKSHGEEISSYISKYPEDAHLWIYRPTKEVAQFILSQDEKSYIECKECGNKYKRLSVTHLKQHSMTLQDYRDKHSIDKLSSENIIEDMKVRYQVNSESINRIKKSSKMELEIEELLTSKGIKVDKNNRNLIHPLEVDLYIPEQKIAIEINGLYWHSEVHGQKHKSYHLNKLESCEKLGIRLVQVFDDEWKSKRDIVEAKLLSMVGLSSNKVYARNCVVKEIDTSVKSEFLNKYHIQADDKSKIKIGLYHEDSLVAVMTFGDLRSALGAKKELGSYELIRFCSSCNVIGGASKLLSYFIKNHNPNKIISYADRRFTTTTKPNLYDKLGFTLKSKTKPNYWYTKDFSKKLHRYNFTKGRLVKEFGANPDMSETDIMYGLGYDKVWDCGNLKYEMQIP
jgi:G:T-mismatch repair DNA endonuclease (very short patch repair protein)